MCHNKIIAFGIWTTVMGAAAPIASADATVTVRKTSGGPQIFVDGEAVPPRFFFGSRWRRTEGTAAASRYSALLGAR